MRDGFGWLWALINNDKHIVYIICINLYISFWDLLGGNRPATGKPSIKHDQATPLNQVTWSIAMPIRAYNSAWTPSFALAARAAGRGGDQCCTTSSARWPQKMGPCINNSHPKRRSKINKIAPPYNLIQSPSISKIDSHQNLKNYPIPTWCLNFIIFPKIHKASEECYID